MQNSIMKLLLKRLHVCYFCGLSERSLFKMFSFNENVPLLLLLLFDCFFHVHSSSSISLFVIIL